MSLAIIVAIAKASGYLSNRLGRSAVLGPTVLNMLHWPLFGDSHQEETVSHPAHLGVLLLMFVAGLEVSLQAMAQVGRR